MKYLQIFGQPPVGVKMFRGGDDITYLFRYLFTIDDANPLDSPISTETGIITEIQDNASNNAIASSELKLGGSAGAGIGAQGGAVYFTDADGNPFSHSGGVVFGLRWQVTNVDAGNAIHFIVDATTPLGAVDYQWRVFGDVNAYVELAPGGFIDTGINVDNTGATTYKWWIALSDDDKVLFYADIEENGYATLWWVAPQQALATVYPTLWGRNDDLDALTAAVAQLAATTFDPFESISGAVAESTTGNASDGDSIFEPEITTLPSAGSVKFRVRKQDATNYWEIEYDSSGNYKLNEIVGGTPSTRISGVAVLSGGEIGKLRLSGNDATLYHDFTALTPYASASNFLREVAWELNSLGTGGVFSDLRIYKTNLRDEIGELEVLVDGDMENAGVGDWLAGSSAILTKETGTPHGGTQVLRVEDAGIDSNTHAYQAGLTVGKLYHYTGWARSDGISAPKIWDGNTLWIGTTSTSWQYFDVYSMVTSSGQPGRLWTTDGNTGSYTEWDDVSIKEVLFTSDLLNNKLEKVIRE